MQINILTLFPEMFKPIFKESIIKRAQEKDLVKINVYNLRDWATDKHKTTDDTAYGGGAGMIMKVDVIDCAIASLKSKIKDQRSKIILLTPKGKTFNQRLAKKLSKKKQLILVCGHYGGVDERVRELIDEEISIGDFVLTGGEIPAMTIVDAIIRLVPKVIHPQSLDNETHSKPGQIQYPQYTRPREFNPKSIKKGTLRVPEVLLSGNHKLISKWRKNTN